MFIYLLCYIELPRRASGASHELRLVDDEVLLRVRASVPGLVRPETTERNSMDMVQISDYSDYIIIKKGARTENQCTPGSE